MVSLDDILGFFKVEFKSLMERFNDVRQLNYSLDEIRENGLVDCNWSQQHINISFKTIPINYYLSNPAHKKLFNDDPEAYKNYFVQVARHEYGHSISSESFDKLRSFILPFQEFFESNGKNQLFRIYLNVIFYDFIANYLVYEKIDKSIPKEHIKINFNSFQTTFTEGYKIFELIKICLLQSQVFFVYKQWDELRPIFIEFGVSQLLEILYIINDIFKRIIIKNMDKDFTNMDSAISDVTNLAMILDDTNWKQIILENNCDESNFIKLTNLRDSL